MFRKLLVANRAEIAIRVMRACRELGIGVAAVYSEADRNAKHIFYADEAYLAGPAPATQSYLSVDRIVEIARTCGADAVHPGYGFLAENPDFARRCLDAGIAFVGPSPSSMESMGDKILSRRTMQAAGVPIVPGTLGPVETAEEADAVASEMGYPIAVKATAGGGGKGLRVARCREEVVAAFEGAVREASGYFGNPVVYVEKYLENPRHVEVQVLADGHGNVIHLGERDCSIQRRHQKLVEESPSPAVTPDLRSRLGEAAVRAARAVGYSSAGTIEFLFMPDGTFYFLEMNTRIQVEHTITEMATGVDLVKEQIRLAAGEELDIAQADIAFRGHAIECRINAEDPADNFKPTPGTITGYSEPGGHGVRVDSGAYLGYTIPKHYDSLIAKLVVWGRNRGEACRRMLRALDEFQIEGVSTTIPFCRQVVSHPVFLRGEATTGFVEHELPASLPASEHKLIGRLPPPGQGVPDRFQELHVELDSKLFHVRVGAPRTTGGKGGKRSKRSGGRTGLVIGGNSERLLSPMQGTVVSVLVQPGQEVCTGQVMCVLEAMKMENEILAHRPGTVMEVAVKVGQTVESGAVLALISG